MCLEILKINLFMHFSTMVVLDKKRQFTKISAQKQRKSWLLFTKRDYILQPTVVTHFNLSLWWRWPLVTLLVQKSETNKNKCYPFSKFYKNCCSRNSFSRSFMVRKFMVLIKEFCHRIKHGDKNRKT